MIPQCLLLYLQNLKPCMYHCAWFCTNVFFQKKKKKGSSVVSSRRSYSQCCSVCYPLLLFIILAACVMACAGLIWMQIVLKEDLDVLKEKLHSSKSLSVFHLYDSPAKNPALL